jgi:hypothetical protein
MTEAEINALELGEERVDVAKIERSVIGYAVFSTIWHKPINACLTLHDFTSHQWRFRVGNTQPMGAKEPEQEPFDTPDEALEGLKKWYRANPQP